MKFSRKAPQSTRKAPPSQTPLIILIVVTLAFAFYGVGDVLTTVLGEHAKSTPPAPAAQADFRLLLPNVSQAARIAQLERRLHKAQKRILHLRHRVRATRRWGEHWKHQAALNARALQALKNRIGGSMPAPSHVYASPASSTGQSVVAYARQFLGVRYVWGGASPSGFDCSGLTQYVYAHFGVSLSHSASGQQYRGYAVSSLAPGDLVFYGSPAYHVAIYSGGGLAIDAPHAGGRVHEHYVGNYSNARRLL